jgi:hypothetical protein
MFRAVAVPIIRSSLIVQLALVHVIQVCRQLTSRAGMFHPGPARKLYTASHGPLLLNGKNRTSE